MKWLIRKITKGLTAVTNFLVSFGAIGLFGIAFLDSALIPLPGGPDAVLMLLSAKLPERMPLYVLAGTIGSVAGCLVLYYLSDKAGHRALEKFSAAKQARVKNWLDKYDVMSVLVAAVLPPPFPFKLFVISAGVFRLNVFRFAIAIAIGRAFRFGLEGYLAVRYGEQAKDLLKQYYPYIGLGVAALVILIFVIKNLVQRRRLPAVTEPQPSGALDGGRN